MEKIILMAALFLFGILSLTKAAHWCFTDIDELYSSYRNNIDVNWGDFRMRLFAKRAFWSIVSAALLFSAFYLFFN